MAEENGEQNQYYQQAMQIYERNSQEAMQFYERNSNEAIQFYARHRLGIDEIKDENKYLVCTLCPKLHNCDSPFKVCGKMNMLMIWDQFYEDMQYLDAF